MEESIVHYASCPVCGSAKIGHALFADDYTVSAKKFDIWECADCSLRFTQDVPDAKSIGAYYQSKNYISHTDNNKGFINRLYHIVRKITLGEKQRLIQSATGLKNGKLLDIGAGTGFFIKHMQLSGWQTTGLEPDQATRERAAFLNNVNLSPAELFYTMPAESFHVITMWHVLEHVHDLHNYVERLKEVLKPGGRIFIAVPNYLSFDAGVYKGIWAAYDVPRHLYHFSPESIKQLMSLHGMQVQSIRSMPYDSFYISFLSEKYKKGNLFRGFLIALISNLKAFINKDHCSSLIYIVSSS
jgi:2-polyprenyl-3-methyl-5-hydroxy-6-metoxy-1,4-benzoquinol methylase